MTAWILLGFLLLLPQPREQTSVNLRVPQVEGVFIPIYPVLPSGGREHGEVQVAISIDRSGEVISAKALSGPDRLKSSAEAAARKWVFHASGQAVLEYILTFSFMLDVGEGKAPGISGVFKPPNRVELYAEPREVVTTKGPGVILTPKKKRTSRLDTQPKTGPLCP